MKKFFVGSTASFKYSDIQNVQIFLDRSIYSGQTIISTSLTSLSPQYGDIKYKVSFKDGSEICISPEDYKELSKALLIIEEDVTLHEVGAIENTIA